MQRFIQTKVRLAASVTAAMLAVSTTGASALILVEKGQPRATIVVAQRALNPAKDDAAARKINTAAHDLQDYVKKMSGAVLPLVADDANPTGALVLVGPSRLTAAMDLDIPSGLTPSRREEGFLIQSGGERLVLAGNDAGPYHGTEYATYEFLNRLGVRWFMPGEFGEVVAQLSTVTIGEMTVRGKPDFLQRDWWLHTTAEMADLEKRWKIRNGMNPDRVFAVPTDGSVANFTAPPEQAKEHPELFARNFDGSVNATLPNLSNPETVKIAAEKVKAWFRAHPAESSLGMAPADGMPRDFNPDTLKRNQGFPDLVGREGVPSEMSGTEEWLEWVNAVAREVNKEFPDHIITSNGYANRNMSPFGVKIDPHVSIMFAAIWSDTLHAYDNPKSWQMVRQGQLLQRWTELNDKVWIYGYSYGMIVSGLTPVPATRKLSHDFPLMKQWGVMGFIDETRNVWAERGIATRYLNARLMWNANADVKKLLADFYEQWYGGAAPPARAFWDALEDTMENTPLLGHEDRILPWVYTPQLMSQLQKHVASAERLASTPREELHVKVDRLILEHLQAYVAMNRADLDGDYAEAARQGERMMQIRPKLHAIHSFFIMPTEKDKNGGVDYNYGVGYWGIEDRVKYYQKLANAMSGKTGTLVALLPERATFAIDPKDEGRFEGWYRADWNTKGWNSVTTSAPFYLQGPRNHPYLDRDGTLYLGAMWYQFKVQVPSSAGGRAVKLYVPVVESEAWLWINGQYTGHRPYRDAYERPNDLEQDVTAALRPGTENVITLRVATGLNRSAVANGLLSRSFLYSPIEANASAR